MASANKKRIRLSSASDSEDVEEGLGMEEDYRKPQETRKLHENGGNCGGKRQILGQNKIDGNDDVLKSDVCIWCDEKDDWVLVCNEPECLVAFHQRCMGMEPEFDELGNFYCSYCWYKRVYIKCKKLLKIEKQGNVRETLKGVDLTSMKDKCTEETESLVGASLNPNREGDELKDMAMKENLQKKVLVAETNCREVLSTDDTDVDERRQLQGRLSEKGHETSDVHNVNVEEGRKQQVRCSERSYGNKSSIKRRKYSDMDQQNKTVDAVAQGHGRNGQGSFHESNQQNKEFAVESQEHELPKNDERVLRSSQLEKGRYGLRRHTQKNKLNKTVEAETHETSVDSNKDQRRKRLGEFSDQRDGDKYNFAEYDERQCQEVMRKDDAAFNEQENFLRKDKQVEQNVSSSFSSPMPTENDNDFTATSRELALVIHPEFAGQEQPIEAQPCCTVLRSHSSQPGQRSIDTERKHKRLFWTPAEEEMLKVGVKKFPGKKNIPWRKILEFGRNVFQDERVPSDLKDKWKSMNKTSNDRKQWVRLSTETQPGRKFQ